MTRYRLTLLLGRGRRWSIVVTPVGGEDRYLRPDGTLDATPAPLPMQPGAPPRTDTHSAWLDFGDDAPEGWYSITLHQHEEDGTLAAEPRTLGLCTMYHDPAGRRDEWGTPIPEAAPAIVNHFVQSLSPQLNRVP